MDEKQTLDYVLIVMKNLNFIIILYIASIIAYSLSGYLQEYSALEFLGKVHRIPIQAWKISVITIGLYFCCLLIMFIQNVTGIKLVIKVCFEIGISYFISYILSFSYMGIMLLILADTLRHFPKSKWKIPLSVIICMIYLILDFDLISSRYDIISLETYLGYFQSNTRFMLLGIKNIISSLNTFIFLVYMILLVQIQMSEKERILSLNELLNKTNEKLQQANVQLEEYAKESEKMAETRERNRLAREIHDTLGHSLTGIITGIEACTTLMDIAPEATKIQLNAIAEVARQGIVDVRRSVKALRPDALERLNLEEALNKIIEEIQLATNAKIDYQCTTKLNCFNEDEEDIIYRIVQESITNSIRHGKAKEIKICISRQYNILKIYIKDNGIGCLNIKKGFGLHHMEERLNMLHGKLFCSGKDGFVVEAHIPIRWGTEEKKND